MTSGLLGKIKTAVIGGARTSAVKIEEAARTGKLHIRILSEQKNLRQTREKLGVEAFSALKENSIDKFADRPGIKDIIRNIDDITGRITELEEKLTEEAEHSG